MMVMTIMQMMMNETYSLTCTNSPVPKVSIKWRLWNLRRKQRVISIRQTCLATCHLYDLGHISYPKFSDLKNKNYSSGNT